MENYNVSFADRIDWWQHQFRGSFNLQLYLQICNAKRNEIKE
jgi:hypothetical protein